MLTERQKALYSFLLEQNNFLTEHEVVIESRLYGAYYETFSIFENFHDSPARHAVTKDIRAINQSNEFDKIIISTPQGVKIATEEEFKHYIDAELSSIFRKLKRTYAKAKKAGLDGQYDFENNLINAFADALVEQKEGV